MQMTIIERCSFLFADCNFCSHEGKSACQPQRLAHGLWKICRVQILFARRQKCVSAPKAGARSLEDLPSAKVNIILETCKRLTVFYFLYSISMQSQSKNKNIVKVSLPTETEQIKIPPLLVGRSNNLGK